jgi:hypothetical protein
LPEKILSVIVYVSSAFYPFQKIRTKEKEEICHLNYGGYLKPYITENNGKYYKSPVQPGKVFNFYPAE